MTEVLVANEIGPGKMFISVAVAVICKLLTGKDVEWLPQSICSTIPLINV